jgi:hypothetical protein
VEIWDQDAELGRFDVGSGIHHFRAELVGRGEWFGNAFRASLCCHLVRFRAFDSSGFPLGLAVLRITVRLPW